MRTLNIHKVLHDVSVEGPGIRSVIWTQGCSIKCKGCINPELQDHTKGDHISIKDIVEDLVSNNAKAITILGGEPLDQEKAIKVLLRELRKAIPEIDIMLFTGYSENTARKKLAKAWQLLDVIVTEPFLLEQSKNEKRKWIGSQNQKIILISNRAKSKYRDWPIKDCEHEFEFDLEYGLKVGL